MEQSDQSKYQEATAVFKLGGKAFNAGVHRTLNRPPKGKGWVQSPSGVMCKPDKVSESIGHFKQAYEIFPDIVALNQIALAYEILGEFPSAREYFILMKKQAEREGNPAYFNAAELGLERTRCT